MQVFDAQKPVTNRPTAIAQHGRRFALVRFIILSKVHERKYSTCVNIPSKDFTDVPVLTVKLMATSPIQKSD